MRLQKALMLSTVVHALDGTGRGAAKKTFNTGFLKDKTILAFDVNDIHVVWSDTLNPVSRNGKIYLHNKQDDPIKWQGYDDWEPL